MKTGSSDAGDRFRGATTTTRESVYLSFNTAGHSHCFVELVEGAKDREQKTAAHGRPTSSSKSSGSSSFSSFVGFWCRKHRFYCLVEHLKGGLNLGVLRSEVGAGVGGVEVSVHSGWTGVLENDDTRGV